MRASVSWVCWLVVFGALLAAPSLAAPTQLQDGHGAYFADKDIPVQMMVDPTGSMTVDQVAASSSFGVFGRTSDPRAAYWIRVSYDASKSTDTWYLFLGFKPNQADLYVPGAHGYSVTHSGLDVPYANRPVRAYGTISFILPSTSKFVYVRVTTFEPDLTIAIDPSGVFWKVNEFNLLVIVALDSVLAALLVSAITLFFMSRNPIFLLYTLYLAAELIGRSNFAGVLAAYVWPHAAIPVGRFGVTVDGLRIVALTTLLRLFLRLPRQAPLMDRLNQLVVVVALIYATLAFVGYPIPLSAVRQYALIYVPIWVISAIVAWRKGDEQAPILVLAWSVFMIGTYAYALKAFVGLGRGNLTTELLIAHGTDVGIALQGLFLSLALSSELRELSRAKDKFEQLSVHDALTGVGNRRLFESALHREWTRAVRSKKSISLLVLDIDHFKAYNDRYGHAAGDNALCDIAHCGERAMRGGDLFCRYGGEEFVAILPEEGAQGALVVASRIQEAVAEAAIPSEASASGILTVSIGVVSMMPEPQGSPAMLFELADQALYRAKEQGRNRIVVSGAV